MAADSSDDVAPTEGTDDGVLRDVLGMSPRVAPPVLTVGQVIDDAYRIEGELGAGGMGRVYRAKDLRLGREVALKLHLGVVSTPADERLAREAAALAKLAHPNVVTVYELGMWAGHRWVAMEYVRGGNARQWLEVVHRKPREIIDVYVAAARGLAAAHKAGLVHRDFKPDNVLVGEDGRARVADFGLARDIDDDSASSDAVDSPMTGTMTRTGAVLGTPAYMAPEQRAAGSVGAAADQFAFAVALWEALAGERPFVGETSAELDAAIASGTTREPAARMPRHVVAALRRALAADADRRWPSIGALADELLRDPTVRRKRIAIGGGLVAIVGASSVWMLTRATEAPVVVCDRASADLDGAWSPAQRDDLGTKLVAAGGDAPRALVAFDAWTANWRAQRVEACEATHVAHVQSPAMLDLRYYCLDRGRASLVTARDLLGSGDRKVAARAVEIATALPALDECADIPRLSGLSAQPTDVAGRMQLGTFDSGLARIDVLLAAGQSELASTEAAALVVRADSIGRPSMRAEARLKHGVALHANGKPDAVLPLYEEAARFAAESHDDHLLAKAWLNVIGILTLLDKANEGERLLTVVDAAITRVGNPPRLRGRYFEARGELFFLKGNYKEARPDIERAIAARTQFEGETPSVARNLNKLGSILSEMRELPAARIAFGRAKAILERAYGGQHRHVAVVLTGLGTAEYIAGDYAAARKTYEQSLAIKEATMGKDHPGLAPTHGNLALALLALSDLDAAEHHAVRALELVEKAMGPKHPKLGQVLFTLGQIQAERGQWSPARATFTRGAVVLEGAGEPPPMDQVLISLARIDIHERDLVSARKHADRALALAMKGPGPESYETGKALRVRSEILAAAGDRAGAKTTLEQVRTLFAKVLGTEHPDYRSTTAQLSALGPP